MKKKLIRILAIIFILVLGHQTFTYADVINPIDDIIDEIYTPLVSLIGFICVVILVVSSISFLCLKAMEKKQAQNNYDEAKSNITKEKNLKNGLGLAIYICVFIISIRTFFNIIGTIRITIFIKILLFSVIFLSIAAIVLRICGKKKISNIILVMLIVVSVAPYFTRENYNKNYNHQISKYAVSESRLEPNLIYVSDVEGLIKTVIKNNKGDRKISIEYEGKIYIAEEELNNLLNEIPTNEKYSIDFKYAEDKGLQYINYITLFPYKYARYGKYLDFEDEKQKGDDVKSFISSIQNYHMRNYTDVDINLIYYSNNGEKKTVELKKAYKLKIQSEKLYDINIQIKSDSIDIIIREN